MSIYQSRNKRPVNYDASQPGAHRVVRSGTSQPADDRGSVSNWAVRRKAEPANVLLPVSRAWVAGLPSDMQPAALVVRFPRIVNALAAVWADPIACRAYLADLLLDHRGNREGFPADVLRDLLRLRDCYYRLPMTLAE